MTAISVAGITEMLILTMYLKKYLNVFENVNTLRKYFNTNTFHS